VSHVSKTKYLGYESYRYKGKCRLKVHAKSVEKMKIQDAESVVPARMESTWIGKLPEGGVEGGGNAKHCTYKKNHSGQTWISIHVSPLPECT
jgi:hypothetical protein